MLDTAIKEAAGGVKALFSSIVDLFSFGGDSETEGVDARSSELLRKNGWKLIPEVDPARNAEIVDGFGARTAWPFGEWGEGSRLWSREDGTVLLKIVADGDSWPVVAAWLWKLGFVDAAKWRYPDITATALLFPGGDLDRPYFAPAFKLAAAVERAADVTGNDGVYFMAPGKSYPDPAIGTGTGAVANGGGYAGDAQKPVKPKTLIGGLVPEEGGTPWVVIGLAVAAAGTLGYAAWRKFKKGGK